MEKAVDALKTVIGGFCMALADSVPGVSGSTVAFVMGFYDRFITALHSLSDPDSGERRRSVIYLLKLFCGWAAGFVGAVMLLSRIFETHCYLLCSLFLGMTAASIPFIVMQEKDLLAKNLHSVWLIAAGVAVTAGMFLLRPLAVGTGITGSALDFHMLLKGQYLFLFAGGVLGIAAMLLPGISGSTLLLILGIYLPAVTSLSSLLHGDFGVLPGVAALGCGIITGVFLSVGFIHKALLTNRAALLYLVIGMVAGSVYAIIQGPAALRVPQPAMTLQTFDSIGFFSGAGIVALLETLTLRK